jgi:hypothetical protein
MHKRRNYSAGVTKVSKEEEAGWSLSQILFSLYLSDLDH